MSRVLGTECFHVFFDGVRSATRRGGAVATVTRSRSLQECSSLLIRSCRWHKGRSRGPPAQAEQWASEFEHLPDHRSEITRVWLASKLRMDAFPRTERLIYERTLKRDLDFASQWHAPQPPSSKVVAFASCDAVLGLAGPVYVLLVYATALGQAQSWPFLLNFFFEFMLVYFLIVPLMILFNKIFLPSLLDERLQQDAFEDDEGFGGASPGAPLTPSDAAPVPELDLDRVDGVEQRIVRMRSYPYKTPLNETPLDFLVAREPELKALVDEARRSRGHGHALALAVDPRLSLEALEQIHDQEHWNPSWSAWLMLNVLGVFLLLPDTMQDIVMEELLLILPAATYLVNEGVLRSTDGRCTGRALSSFVAFASMACLFGVGFRVDGVFVGYRSRFAKNAQARPQLAARQRLVPDRVHARLWARMCSFGYGTRLQGAGARRRAAREEEVARAATSGDARRFRGRCGVSASSSCGPPWSRR